MHLPPSCWRLEGTQPGPRVTIIGGTHGDELVGVEVIRALKALFSIPDEASEAHPHAITGTLTLLIGNPEAVQKRQRSSSGVRDLNRCFIQADLDREPSVDDISDLIRAREVAPLLAESNVVIDLHGTSSDSPAFVCFGSDSPKHRELYELLPVHCILTDPYDVLSRDEGRPGRGTTDDYTERHGGIALGYETGREDDLTRVPGIFDDVLRMLVKIGTLSADSPLLTDHPEAKTYKPRTQTVYTLKHSIHAHSAEFVYVPGMNTGWQTVQAGQLIGTYRDGTEERVPEDGMLVFPKSANKLVAGKNLYYLAVEVRP